MAWGLPQCAFMVVILGTAAYDGREHRYVDYSVPDLLQMVGRAGRPLAFRDDTSVALLMTHAAKKDYYTKFLDEPFPVEVSRDASCD